MDIPTKTILGWGFIIAAVAAWKYRYILDLFNRLSTQPQPTVQNIEAGKKGKKRKMAQRQDTDVLSTSASEATKATPQDLKSSKSNAKIERNLEKIESAGLSKSKAVPSAKPSAPNPKKPDSLAPRPETKLRSPSLSSTTTSSVTDGDADDDLSFGSTAATSRAGDVSDMLEPQAPKTLTLSIKSVGDALSKKSSVTKKAPEVAANKKQRARQRKAAEVAEQVKLSNAAHAAKGQQQMHIARTAEGTSKQTKAQSFTSQQPSVWQTVPGKAKDSPLGPAAANGVPDLLDTMEHDDTAIEPSEGAVSAKPWEDLRNGKSTPNRKGASNPELRPNGTSARAASTREYLDRVHSSTSNGSWADEVSRARGMSEEEQVQLLRQQQEDQQWQSAPSKKSKRKMGRPDTDASSDGSSEMLTSKGLATAKATGGVKKIPAVSNNRFDTIAATGRQSPEV